MAIVIKDHHPSGDQQPLEAHERLANPLGGVHHVEGDDHVEGVALPSLWLFWWTPMTAEYCW